MGESPGSVEDNEKLASRAVPTRALDGEEMINLFILFYLYTVVLEITILDRVNNRISTL
jgi:hypothetical protein